MERFAFKETPRETQTPAFPLGALEERVLDEEQLRHAGEAPGAEPATRTPSLQPRLSLQPVPKCS